MSTLRPLLPKLLQHNFSGISNLRSLRKLLNASSPVASDQFANHGPTIFEHALSSGEMHKYTCALIRIATLVRSKALPPRVDNLATLTDFVRHETTAYRYWPPTWKFPPTRLPPTIPASVLRGILATHLHIESQTISCLDFYLNRFKPLRPCHLVDPTFIFTSGYDGEPDGHFIAAFQKRPAQKPFPVRDIGPPTWIEEQRVIRAFWRVQLLRDLKEAAATNSLQWPEAELEQLDKTSAVDFHHHLRLAHLRSSCPLDDISAAERERLHQERMHVLGIDSEWYDPKYSMWTEAIEAGEMTADWDVGVNSVPELLFDENADLLSHRLIHFSEDELVWSVMEYAEEASQAQAATASELHSERDWSVPAKGDHDWDPVCPDLSAAVQGFYNITGRRRSHKWEGLCSPLQHVSFRPFRRLGFAIWSDERMYNYGLLRYLWNRMESREEEGRFSPSSIVNAWRSILGEAELLEVERRNLAWMNGTVDSALRHRPGGPDA